MSKRLFDFSVGNPPYQIEVEGNQRKRPVYCDFMDAAYEVADKTELITPARFLFNAGQTPKEWNRKMLSDPHLKVLQYFPDASAVFPGSVEIKGGVAVTYHDVTEEHEPIGTFIADDNKRNILSKVLKKTKTFLDTEVVGAVPYKFSETFRKENPEGAKIAGASFDLRTNILDKLGDLAFSEQKPDDGKEYAGMYGLYHRKRTLMWIRRDYITIPKNFNAYKALISKASGQGTYGEKLVEPVIIGKGIGHTQSFISIGNFDTEAEAEHLVKYIKCKFTRALIGIQKVTQDITARCFKYVPLQDFTSSSDIDWSKSIAEIDQQLYKKYGLTADEIEFVESHVKEME